MKTPHRRPSEFYQPQTSRSILAAIVALGLAGTLESKTALAQNVPAERREEYLRHFNEGNSAYRRGDFATVRRAFLQAESIAPSVDMGWNIAMANIHIAGFEVVNPETPDANAVRMNASNRARLDTVLGFTTLQQLEPVRDMLIDALRRAREYRNFYQTQLQNMETLPAPTNSQERAERRRSREFNTQQVATGGSLGLFVETTLQRIETRYRELQTANNTTRVNPDNRLNTNNGQIIVVGGQEYIERRETNWFTTPRAVVLTTALAGLATAGVGLTGYLLNANSAQADLALCRELHSRMDPCSLALEQSFQENSGRASAFGPVGWIGGGIAAVSVILFAALPAENRVTRERRTVPASAVRTAWTPGFTITPSVSRTTAGVQLGVSF